MIPKLALGRISLRVVAAGSLLAALGVPSATQAAPPRAAQQEARVTAPLVEHFAAPDGRSGHGFRRRAAGPCLSAEERAWVLLELEASQRELTAQGLLPYAAKGPILFDWPLNASGAAAGAYGVHGISNFVDLDPLFPDSLLDYACGDRSYDLSSGYNHQGVDYFTWPFPWLWMDADAVEMVAIAPGTIVLKSDGNFDESCGFFGGSWNAVYVQHLDGSVAWYGHMKNGSLTAKAVGDKVAAGEYLGVIGSSGNSTGPHLHLEVYDGDGDVIEPYAGPCNDTVAQSRWIDQRPYYDSAVNLLLIGDDPVSFPDCPGRAVTNEAASLGPGQLGYFTTFYRDQLASQTSQYRILRPDGTTWHSWSHSSPATHYSASWWWWSWFLPSGPSGVWTFEVEFDGVTYSTEFTVL